MKSRRILPLLPGLCLALALSLYLLPAQPGVPSYTLEELPAYDGSPTVILNENQPDFPDRDKTSQAFERYSQLDYFGRCGAAYANVGPETMPTEERGSIGQVKPSGWQTVKYDFVDGKYLYNRCHLIGWQLTGENANELNLITGTRYLNVQGMLPYENEVADYVRETGNHVLYRVTPLYGEGELVAHGVEMEAFSVEDKGKGVCFHVYAYNVQPGVVIDYATGESWAEGSPAPEASPTPSAEETAETEGPEGSYVLNTSSQRFHLPSCSGAESIKAENRQAFYGTREELVEAGYVPCGSCKP